MSDGFDKEAEREKLREKFAEDEQKREHTQRMSELLLKGATMTNRHCDDCGDPIFRQDGREFCPTCHTVDAADVADAAVATGAAETADSAGTADAAGAVDAADTSAIDTSAADVSASPPTTDSGSSTATGASNTETGSTAGNASRTTGNASRTTRETPTVSDAVETAGVADARASLTRTLTRFARAAEETDDPRRAREHLQAAREAAETLAALD
ncbi:MAG: Sjogren's syndrome/scleroderma autoantigen 1 family protein [Halorubrum sp.]